MAVQAGSTCGSCHIEVISFKQHDVVYIVAGIFPLTLNAGDDLAGQSVVNRDELFCAESLQSGAAGFKVCRVFRGLLLNDVKVNLAIEEQEGELEFLPGQGQNVAVQGLGALIGVALIHDGQKALGIANLLLEGVGAVVLHGKENIVLIAVVGRLIVGVEALGGVAV